MAEERRQSTLRRQVNEIGMHGGELQESKVWAQIGKGLCVWLIYKHAETLINHPDALVVLLGMLILPEIAKKIITMYFTRGTAGFTRRVESHDSSVTVTPVAKNVDHPPPKEEQP